MRFALNLRKEAVLNTESVFQKINPIVDGLGYEIVDVEWAKRDGADNLTVYIDIPTGVSLDDCEKVHRAIDPALDELDPTDGKPYVLNVSSPGLDRPFKNNAISSGITARKWKSNFTRRLKERKFTKER